MGYGYNGILFRLKDEYYCGLYYNNIVEFGKYYVIAKIEGRITMIDLWRWEVVIIKVWWRGEGIGNI